MLLNHNADAHRRFALPTHCFPFCPHTSGLSSEIKTAHCESEIKIMALKSTSIWSSQNQPYGPLVSLFFLHSVLSNMEEEIRVQPACLSLEESTEV